MKKTFSIVLLLAMLVSLLSFSGCSTTNSEDINYVKNKGALVIGVIDAKPLTYQNEYDEWEGFAVDLGKAFAKELGVEAVFREIEWAEMDELLADKIIDCVSSALTITNARKEKMALTAPYMTNAQIAVMKSSVARRYSSAEECLQLRFAVLDGSTHEALAKENGFLRFAANTTEEALQAVSDGTADAAILNSTTANEMIGKGNQFDDLSRAFDLKKNKFGFGFRKDSGLANAMNDFFVTTYTSGKMKTLAKKYGLEKMIVEQVTEQ
ncbi:MAG: amino acid ABC transporter substrate-binding protein [Clostridia bacterium]|nr:amino acid ABC transporter substrate-binding protein [Clostridia bacterium]